MLSNMFFLRATLIIHITLAPWAVNSLSSSSTSGHFRTVNNNGVATLSSSSSSSIKTSETKKHPNLHHIFPLANINNNNNNHINSTEDSSPLSFFIEQKCSSRAPIQIIEQDLGILDNHQINRRSRPKSALSSSINENSVFHIVHNPNHNHTHLQQQQYVALLKVLKSQETQVEQQRKELDEQQKGLKRKIKENNKIALFSVCIYFKK